MQVIRTSRIYAKRGGQWQQVHHHGAIDDSRLLSGYQAAVFGAPLRLSNAGPA